MGGISIVGGGEVVTMEEDMGKGDGVGKSDLLSEGVCLGYQSVACSVGRKRQKVHLGVVTFEGRVAGDGGQEDKVVVDIKDRELMIYNKCFYKR